MTTPLVFAHRGSSAALPEHTRAAYERAIAEGADGLECDVRLTRDGHLVCIHDALVDRTSDGRGRVSATTLAELDRFDYASWHQGHGAGANGGQPKPSGTGESGPTEGILTLDGLICLARAAGRPMRLLIETKHPSRFGRAVEEQVVATLARHGLTTAEGAAAAGLSVTVMSFSPLAVRHVRALAPEVPTVFLFDVAPKAVREGRPPFGATLLGPGLNAVKARPELVRRAHERGRQVYVWTVNQPEDVDLMISLGVDGVISDRPADVLAKLGRTP